MRRFKPCAAAGVLLILLGLQLASPTMASAGYRKFGEQYFNNTIQSEKYGVRGWFRTVSPHVGSAGSNFSLSRVCVAAEPGYSQPYVECGFYKGHGRPTVTKPTWFWAYNPTGYAEDFFEAAQRTWQDLAIGSLHKYAVSRTDHFANGDTEWTFFFDGEALVDISTPRPDYGHPHAGGELYCGYEADPPNMNAQGRNNGTGESGCYFCFKSPNGSWYRWDTDYSSSYDVDVYDGITFAIQAPYYSYFDATGN